MMIYSTNGDTFAVPHEENESPSNWALRAKGIVDGGSPPGPGVKVDSWTQQNGGTVYVITTKKPNETEQEWCDRHDAAVDAFMEQFPCPE